MKDNLHTDDLVEDDDFTFNEDSENIINKKNKDEFDNIMSGASNKLDGYWDKSNIAIKIVSCIIWFFAIFGVLYYLILWFSNKQCLILEVGGVYAF